MHGPCLAVDGGAARTRRTCGPAGGRQARAAPADCHGSTSNRDAAGAGHGLTTEETLARGVEALLHDAASRLGLAPGERDWLAAPDREPHVQRRSRGSHLTRPAPRRSARRRPPHRRLRAGPGARRPTPVRTRRRRWPARGAGAPERARASSRAAAREPRDPPPMGPSEDQLSAGIALDRVAAHPCLRPDHPTVERSAHAADGPCDRSRQLRGRTEPESPCTIR